jgi:integrase
MPRRIIPLSDTKVRNAKPTSKQRKLFDGGGLFLLVTPSGGKLWNMKYRFDGKERKLSFGTYPEISLADARAKREVARKQLANDIDPGAVKKAMKESFTQETETFELIAREWHSRFISQWTPGHAKTIITRLERDVFPWLGSSPIAKIKAPDLLKTLRRVESRGAVETAHRIKTVCGQVFRYAVATGRAERDPATDLKGALQPVQKKHLAAITDPKEAAGLLRSIDNYQGHLVTKYALKLAPLLFARPGELRQMEWAEIDFETAEWNLPASKMKMKLPHLVPLCRQAISILKDVHPLTSKSRYVFPSPRTNSRPMSNNAILSALRRMGYQKEEMSGHGFRAMARTILDEVLQVRPDFIEHQLAHAVRDPNGRAYNRTAHLKERKKMMQKWANYLDALKDGSKILAFKQAEF